MVTQNNIKKLLTRKLSGREVGKLLFQSNWEIDHDRTPPYTDRELALLVNSLKYGKDIDEYNSFIQLYRMVDFLTKEGQIIYLQMSLAYEKIDRVSSAAISEYFAQRVMESLPLIVTEKQFRDLKKKRRKERLNTYHSLDEVIVKRAATIASQELQDQHIDNLDRLNTVDPERKEQLLQRAQTEIMTLVQSGKLTPLQPDVKASDDIDWSGQWEDIDEWGTIDTDTPADKEWLHRTCIIAQQLYKAKLPEWVKDVETFTIYHFHRDDDARNTDLYQWIPESVAVIQDPVSSNLTKKGYYDTSDILSKLKYASGMDMAVDALAHEVGYDDIQQAVKVLANTIQNGARGLMARKQVLEEVSTVVGIDCTQDDFRSFAEGCQYIIKRYNEIADSVPSSPETTPDEDTDGNRTLLRTVMNRVKCPIQLPKVSPIKRSKPAATDLQYARSIISLALGKDWRKRYLKQAEQTAREDGDD